MRIFNIFDYVYYRYAKFYNKYDGVEKGDLKQFGYSYTALLMTSLSQVLFVLALLGIYIFKILNVKSYEVSTVLKIIVILGAFLIVFLNYLRYRKKLNILEEKWGKQTKKQKYLGSLVVLMYFLFPFIFFVVAMKYL